MSSHVLSSIRVQDNFFNNFNRGLYKLDNLKNAAAKTAVSDSKLMMLKLKRARLESQLAYSRTQALIAEMELHIAEKELQHELTLRRRLVRLSAARSRARRPCKIMKPIHKVTKLSPHLETCKNTEIVLKTTDVSTQVDMDVEVGVTEGPKETVEGSAERRTTCRRKKKRSSEREERKERRVVADETPDTARVATSCSETKEITNPRKKRKTDIENIHITVRNDNAKHKKTKEKHHSKTKCGKVRDRSHKIENNTELATSNNGMQFKGTTGNDENHASKKNESDSADKAKKPIKSILKTPTIKELNNNHNMSDTDEDTEGNHSSNKVNSASDIEKVARITEDINHKICKEASGDKSGKDTETVTKVSNRENTFRVEESSNKTQGISNENKLIKVENCDNDRTSINAENFTVILEITDNNLMQQIQEMCEEPENLDTLNNSDLEIGDPILKLDRSPSISSLETLILQEYSNEDFPI